jgi:hypothetical protein
MISKYKATEIMQNSNNLSKEENMTIKAFQMRIKIPQIRFKNLLSLIKLFEKLERRKFSKII